MQRLFRDSTHCGIWINMNNRFFYYYFYFHLTLRTWLLPCYYRKDMKTGGLPFQANRIDHRVPFPRSLLPGSDTGWLNPYSMSSGLSLPVSLCAADSVVCIHNGLNLCVCPVVWAPGPAAASRQDSVPEKVSRSQALSSTKIPLKSHFTPRAVKEIYFTSNCMNTSNKRWEERQPTKTIVMV